MVHFIRAVQTACFALWPTSPATPPFELTVPLFLRIRRTPVLARGFGGFDMVLRLLLFLLLAGLLLAPPALAMELPPGFVDEEYFFLLNATSLSWAPDGALWVSQRTGGVWVYRDPQLINAHTLDVDWVTGERGFHTLHVDPDYMTNGHIWVFYTPTEQPARNRLSRLIFVNDVFQSEEIVLEIPQQNTIHNGGCMAFAEDKTLFLGVGDDFLYSVSGQDPTDIHATILHINRDGTPAWDNPFPDGVGGDPRVWAWGFRNPYRCSIQPETDNLFIADIGSFKWEEINIGVAGGNFGWAEVEGGVPAGQPGYVYPLYSYPSRLPDGTGAAVISGDHVEAGEFNPLYEGNYFFGDWLRREMYRMVLDENNNVAQVELWATDTGSFTDIEFGPDGAMYYGVRSQPSIRRVSWVGGQNTQPVAIATANPDSGAAPLAVTLDGSASFDPDDDPLTYSWDLGDQSSTTGELVNHTYPQGVYEAQLTVDDGNGLSATSPLLRIVSGNNRPSATITSPADGANYNAGQEFTYTGTGSDPEEGNVPCSRFTWQVLLRHNTHAHPFLGPLQGDCSGTFTTATQGETDSDVTYEVRLVVEDTGAPIGDEAKLSGEHSVEIFPNTSTMTFESSPVQDLTLTLDTVPFTARSSVEGVVNLTRTIGVVDDQVRKGHTYNWISWSDGGAKSHSISTPATDTTFEARFGCDVIVEVSPLSVEKGPGGTLHLTWPPVVDPCLSADLERYRIYAASTPVPSTPPGQFPDDPAFTLVGSTDAESFEYLPAPEHQYFLVVAVGSDSLDGAAGHY